MEDGGLSHQVTGEAGLRESAAVFIHRPVGARARRSDHVDLVCMADIAAFELRRTRPAASAGTRLSPPFALIAGPALFLAGCLIAAPGAFLAGLAGLIVIFVTAASALRLAAVLFVVRDTARAVLDENDLPAISVIVALHDEAAVIAGLSRSLARLDYPRGKLEILFAIEADDTRTLAAARAVARHHPIRVVAVPDIGPRTKPKALNLALQLARGELIAVYDAEDAPQRGQLRAAAEAFAGDSRLGCVQAPLGWYNAADNWLTRQFALEYAMQFHAIVPFLARLSWPVPLGGTSNVFRRRALQACGGWDPFNVTEDADLGFRLVRDGWRIGTIEPGTLEEAPLSVKAWSAQRSRWLKGHLVSWLVQMRDPRGLWKAAGLGGYSALHLTLGWNALSALAHAPCLVLTAGAIGLQLAAGQGVPVWALVFSGAVYLCGMTGAALSAPRADIKVAVGDLVTLPAYWLLQVPAMFRALNEVFTRPYFWAKTEHGLSPGRRKAPDEKSRGLGLVRRG